MSHASQPSPRCFDGPRLRERERRGERRGKGEGEKGERGERERDRGEEKERRRKEREREEGEGCSLLDVFCSIYWIFPLLVWTVWSALGLGIGYILYHKESPFDDYLHLSVSVVWVH